MDEMSVATNPNYGFVSENEGDEPKDKAKALLSDIDAAIRREKKWRKRADECFKLYEEDKGEGTQYNIFYSNTEILHPALYNRLPRPIVERRYRTDDPVAMKAAELAQRFLEFQIENGQTGFAPTFDDCASDCILDALVVGRGVARVKYNATFDNIQPPAALSLMEGAEQPAEEVKTDEYVTCERVPWDWFCHGYAKAWHQVPWVAFMHKLTRQEMKEKFGDDVTKEFKDAYGEPSTPPDGEVEGLTETRENIPETGLYDVWEVWERRSKKVFFVSRDCPQKMLMEYDDPLGLKDFYPMPAPLMLFRRVSGLEPVCLYSFYKEQSRQLGEITERLEKLTESMRLRGFYDSSITGIEDVLAAGDNVMIPIQDVAVLTSAGGNLAQAVQYVPIDMVVGVINQLYAQRDRIRAVIYELTGLADIMRGVSTASETLGAQRIKDAWGTQRLRKSQRAAQNFLRDILRIEVELAFSFFDTSRLMKITDMRVPTQQDRIAAMQGLMREGQDIQQQAAMLAQQNPGHPPSQELEQKAKEIVRRYEAVKDEPTIDAVMSMMKDDEARGWRIDIETGSTLDNDVAEDKQELAEMFNAMAQFLNGISPYVSSGLMSFDGAKALLLEMTRRFRFGRKAEEALGDMSEEGMKKEEGQKETPQEKVAALRAQAEAKIIQMKAQAAQQEHEYKLKELALKNEELALKNEAQAAKTQGQMAVSQQRVAGQLRAEDAKQKTAAAKAFAASQAPFFRG